MIVDMNIDRIRYQILDKFMLDECNLYQETWIPMHKWYHNSLLSDYSEELSNYVKENKYTVDAFGVQCLSYVNEFKTLPIEYLAENSCDRADKTLLIPLNGAVENSKIHFYDIPTDIEDPYEAVDMHVMRNKEILNKNSKKTDQQLIEHLFDLDDIDKYDVTKRLNLPYWIIDRKPILTCLLKDNAILYDNKLSYTVDHYVPKPDFVTFNNIITFTVKLSHEK